MKYYKCNHRHNGICLFKRDDPKNYELYIKWKYSVGFRGNCDMCWECYKKLNKISKNEN